MYATCATDGCWNLLKPILVTGEFIVCCGSCGQPVTNITDIKPTEGTVLPEWILEKLQTRNSQN